MEHPWPEGDRGRRIGVGQFGWVIFNLTRKKHEGVLRPVRAGQVVNFLMKSARGSRMLQWPLEGICCAVAGVMSFFGRVWKIEENLLDGKREERGKKLGVKLTENSAR